MTTRPMAIVIASLVLSTTAEVQAAESLRTRFQNEAPAGWKALREAARNRQGSVTIVAEPIEGFDPKSASRIENAFVFSGENLLLHYIFTPTAKPENRANRVFGVNHDYSFSIRKFPGQGSWNVGQVNRAAGPIVDAIHEFAPQVFVADTLDLHDLTLAWIVAQPGFRVISLEPASRPGMEAVELRFTTTSYQRPEYQIRGGRVQFDASRSWCVLEYELDVHLDKPARSFGRVEYEDLDGMPAPKHFIYDFEALSPEKKRYHHRQTCDFTYTKTPVDPSVFRLTAYGLPEPSQPASPGWPAWSGPVALGVACLGVAGLLRYRARQTATDV